MLSLSRSSLVRLETMPRAAASWLRSGKPCSVVGCSARGLASKSAFSGDDTEAGSSRRSSGYGKYVFWGTVVGASLSYIVVYGAPTDLEKSQGDEQDSLLANAKRTFRRMSFTLDSYKEPVFEKLLPDPYQGPEAKPYTLVIDLDRFLICHMWDPVVGRWKVAKRPGVDMFLFYMAHMYEIVVFSSMSQFEADMIMEKLDPLQCVTFRLYRFATKYEDGKYIKDVTRLNRDLSKVVVFGHDDSFGSHADNFIRVAPWDGDPKDRLLEDSIDFLEALAFSNVPDVRNVLHSYAGRQPIDEFDAKQRAMYELAREARLKDNQSYVKRFLMKLFSFESNKSQGGMPGVEDVSYDERKAQFHAQRKVEYERERERIQKEVTRQIEANKEYLAKHKMPLYDLVTKGPPPPPPELLAGSPSGAEASR